MSGFPLSLGENTTVRFYSSEFSSNFVPGDSQQSLQDVMITALPGHGQLSFVGTAVTVGQEIPANELQDMTYQPDASFVGPDSFSWNGCDNLAYSDADAAVSLQVIPDRRAPGGGRPGRGRRPEHADHDHVGSQPYGWETIPMILTVVTSPSDGTLDSFDPMTGDVTYTPANDYRGSDTFSYTLSMCRRQIPLIDPPDGYRHRRRRAPSQPPIPRT